jgi:hypothetical protein
MCGPTDLVLADQGDLRTWSMLLLGASLRCTIALHGAARGHQAGTLLLLVMAIVPNDQEKHSSPKAEAVLRA